MDGKLLSNEEIKAKYFKSLELYILEYKNFNVGQGLDELFGKEDNYEKLLQQCILLLEYTIEFLTKYNLLYKYKARFFLTLHDKKKMIIPDDKFSLKDEIDFRIPAEIEILTTQANNIASNIEEYYIPMDNIIELPENLKKNCRVFYRSSRILDWPRGKDKYCSREISCEYYPDDYIGESWFNKQNWCSSTSSHAHHSPRVTSHLDDIVNPHLRDTVLTRNADSNGGVPLKAKDDLPGSGAPTHAREDAVGGAKSPGKPDADVPKPDTKPDVDAPKATTKPDVDVPAAVKPDADVPAATKPDVNAIYNYETILDQRAEFLGDFDLYTPGTLTTKHAETFTGYKYKTYKLIDDIVLYRAGSKDAPFGEYFSFEPPISEAQVRMDKAIKHQWESGVRSIVDYAYEIKIPKGTEIHIGKISSQNEFYFGGTEQVIIEKSWMIQGIKVINSYPIK